MQSGGGGDGDQAIEYQNRDNDGPDRLDTASNAGSVSACSLFTEAEPALGDAESEHEQDNDTSLRGQPYAIDKYQTGTTTLPVDYDNEPVPGWTLRYNSRPENGNLGWAFANG